MNKQAYSFASNGVDIHGKPAKGYSYASANPLGFIMGGVKVPEWVSSLVPGINSKSKTEREKAQRTAAALTIFGGSAILGAGLMGVGKGVQYLFRRTGLAEGDNAAAGLGYKMTGTFDPAFTKTSALDKKAWEVGFPDTISWGQALGTAGAVGTMLLAAGLTDYAGDSVIGKLREKRLTKKIDRRDELYKDMITARALNARGNLSDKEYNSLMQRVEAEGLKPVKTASLHKTAEPDPIVRAIEWIQNKAKAADNAIRGSLGDPLHKFKEEKLDPAGRTAMGAIGLLLAGVGVASGVGAYSYFSRQMEGNLKYDAMKKGLREYAKGKAATAPVTLLSPGQAYFDKLDAVPPEQQQAAATQAYVPATAEPEINLDAINRPVSMEL